MAHLVVWFRWENIPLLHGDVDGVQVAGRNVLVCLVLVATKHIDGLAGLVVDSTVAIHPCQHTASYTTQNTPHRTHRWPCWACGRQHCGHTSLSTHSIHHTPHRTHHTEHTDGLAGLVVDSTVTILRNSGVTSLTCRGGAV